MQLTHERMRSPEFRQGLLDNQFDLALEFYSIPEPDTDQTRERHRNITQEMAFNSIDLTLPRAVDTIRVRGLERIALVAPLRGALAIVTPPTVSHLKDRLRIFKLEEVPVDLFAIGVKRHPESNIAEIYFRSGYVIRDLSEYYAFLTDWGTATGLTFEKTAQDLYEGGLPFEQMTSVSMTLASEGKERLIHGCPGLAIEAATSAQLNSVNYIDRIAPTENDSFVEVTPKDWGAKMWGMEDRDEPPQERLRQIDFFIKSFQQNFAGFITSTQLSALRSHYIKKYIPDRNRK